jgi:hypothetical protein
MLYDILSTLWEQPAPAEQLHHAVTFRTGTPTSARSLERYLQLLAECGYLNALERGGAQVYTIAERGSLLLADVATKRESAHAPTFMEA